MKKIEETKKRKAVTISMSETEWQSIQNAAEQQGVSVSTYIRLLHNKKKSA